MVHSRTYNLYGEQIEYDIETPLLDNNEYNSIQQRLIHSILQLFIIFLFIVLFILCIFTINS